MTVFYTPSGNPATGALGLSAAMRSEFALIQTAFSSVSDVLSNAIGRNRLHNGGFRVNQRGYAGAALGAGAYGHDRWKAGAGGCTYSAAPLANSFIATISAGSLIQVVEATDIEGGTYVLSWLGTATARIGAAAFGASPQTASVSAGANLNIEFQGGYLFRPQLELGTNATSFEQISIGLDVVKCQRFFAAGAVRGATYAGAGGGVTGAFYSFPATMRTAPSMTIAGAAYTNGSAGALTGYVDGYQPAWTATGAGATAFTGTFTASADL